VSGGDPTRFFDSTHAPADPPNEWRHLPVNAILAVRGVYIQKKLIGLTFDVTDLEYGEIAQPTSPFPCLPASPSEP
jgi:hypothetical protein